MRCRHPFRLIAKIVRDQDGADDARARHVRVRIHDAPISAAPFLTGKKEKEKNGLRRGDDSRSGEVCVFLRLMTKPMKRDGVKRGTKEAGSERKCRRNYINDVIAGRGK